MRRAVRISLALLAALALLAGGAGLWARSRVAASLPLMEGRKAVAGLRAPVRIERDRLGVPRIVGQDRLDVARATGFVHAQDRFFQMDLLRRRAAGELSALFGPVALEVDRSTRVYRFRAVARRALAESTADEQAAIAAYASGVNAGLGALSAPPFEYLVLRATPGAWQPEDSLLVPLAMYLTLQGEDPGAESSLGVMADVLPAELSAFLAPPGTEWDAPVVGSRLAAAPMPPAAVFDLRNAPAGQAAQAVRPAPDERFAAGSNNWAVAGSHTGHGGALLADDMHLEIGVPNTWYRAFLEWPDPARPGERVTIGGATLPGTPAVIVGSNTHVAWGFTNTEGDWSDLVIVEPAPGDADAYQTPEGPRRYEHVTEIIEVKGAPAATLDVVSTVFGPIVDVDHQKRRRAHAWVAERRGGVNLALVGIEDARTLEQALAVANTIGAPAQNFTCADRTGRVGWTVMGRMPKRVGFSGRVPTSWADGSRRWEGWLDPAAYPRIVDPPSGRIWTANARVVDGERLAIMGDGGYDLGARAGQIRDALFALDRATEQDMLKVQLDDRALFLSRWRELLLGALADPAAGADPRRALARKLVESWGGRAAPESAGYRIVRAFRLELADQVMSALTAACRKADERFEWGDHRQWEEPLWALVTQRPMHLLDPAHPSWEAQLIAAFDKALDRLTERGPDLRARTWGERNTGAFRHPLSRALPWLETWLDLPPDPLPGDSNMPRYQSPTGGASERMVVSPGREDQGIFHMPGGQSGHPLSPHYRDGHAAWARGEATPFLPGPPMHVLTLEPASP